MRKQRKKFYPWTMSLVLMLALMSFARSSPAQNSSSNAQMTSVLENNNRKLAQAMERLNAIQQEFQSIKGQIDASKFLTKESDRVYQDLDSRVSTLEDKMDQIYNLLKEISAKQASGSSNVTNALQAAEYQSFQSMLALVNARDYQAAASGFLGFLKKYPNSEYAPKAMFWVGECYYFLGDYARAIKSFQEFTDKYPQDNRVKEAIYRQGLAFSRLKKYQEAKLFFQKVMANYPNTAEAAKAQTRLHRIEEMEKSQMAMETPSEPSSANQPISKPSPYPRPEQPQKRPESTYDKSQAPLF